MTVGIPVARKWQPLRASMAAGAFRQIVVWRVLQYVLVVVGVVLVGMLFTVPEVGINLLWNGLIPLAPVLLVVLPGVWRNICPMATFSLLPQRLGWGRSRVLSKQLATFLSLTGLAALLIIVPLRHICFDTNGAASALMLLGAAAVAFLVGLFHTSRGAWCNSLCPIHFVEKLYGQAPAWTPANARCAECSKCSRPCPDSTRSMNPAVTSPGTWERAAGHATIGGLVGFIWGWNHVGDMHGPVSLADIGSAFAWPYAGGLVSLLFYALIYRYFFLSPVARRHLITVYAWAAVTLYYWYRLPALMGFNEYFGTGMLVDWRAHGEWLVWSARIVSTSFLSWFLLLRGAKSGTWLERPPAASKVDVQISELGVSR